MNVKTFSYLALALPLLTTVSTAKADLLASIKSSGVLRCAVYSDVPPFAAPDTKTRQLVGMDIDLCQALSKQMGVKAQLVPTSVEARVPVIATGRADVLIANLAYTKTRSQQIQFSDPYYVAKEMLVVKAANADKPLSFFKGKRISANKGTTSEQSIVLKGGKPVTFQDAASAFLALEQNKVMGFVTNTMTATKMISQAKSSGIDLAMVKEPMALEPIGVGMKQGEPALLTAVNSGLKAMDEQGTIDKIWNQWLGPNTDYKMTREEHVQPLSSLTFQPLD
ncbi:ABC transporter substrate-binding protein [Tatumella ptyseos]|uniref:ABC transporter substrate-binding protein n=1 Tax=Tatumella ptyseos TaxID=82987 RepID=UPI0026F18A52|nr:ABC transporter substrate-binding protein [Tatumella ptyseos]WKX26983.1 ABC transporter substrate-binding protein [Tatumella ptyseos]